MARDVVLDTLLKFGYTETAAKLAEERSRAAFNHVGPARKPPNKTDPEEVVNRKIERTRKRHGLTKKGYRERFGPLTYKQIEKEAACKARLAKKDRAASSFGIRHGLGFYEYLTEHSKQKGRCAICGERSMKRFVVDHDHETGKYRGLLCGLCNTAIGLLKDDFRVIREAARYVARHKTDNYLWPE